MASEKVKTFTDADFEASTKVGVVLVDFWAPWCAPCRRLAPTVDQLADEYNGRLTVAKVNIDENPVTPNRFFIRGIPTLLLFKNGELKETVVGLAAKDDLVRVIDKHLNDREQGTGHRARPSVGSSLRIQRCLIIKSQSSGPALPDSRPLCTLAAPISSRLSSKASRRAAS